MCKIGHNSAGLGAFSVTRTSNTLMVALDENKVYLHEPEQFSSLFVQAWNTTEDIRQTIGSTVIALVKPSYTR